VRSGLFQGSRRRRQRSVATRNGTSDASPARRSDCLATPPGPSPAALPGEDGPSEAGRALLGEAIAWSEGHPVRAHARTAAWLPKARQGSERSKHLLRLLRNEDGPTLEGTKYSRPFLVVSPVGRRSKRYGPGKKQLLGGFSGRTLHKTTPLWRPAARMIRT